MHNTFQLACYKNQELFDHLKGDATSADKIQITQCQSWTIFLCMQKTSKVRHKQSAPEGHIASMQTVRRRLDRGCNSLFHLAKWYINVTDTQWKVSSVRKLKTESASRPTAVVGDFVFSLWFLLDYRWEKGRLLLGDINIYFTFLPRSQLAELLA